MPRRWSYALLWPLLATAAEAQHVEEGVPFVERGERRLLLDVALPKAAEGRRPALLLLHGGGWRQGDRRALRPLLETAAARGYVAVAPSYRFAPEHRWPAQIDDVAAAWQWLSEHAGEFGVDVERVGIAGFSAGAHLALMFAARSGERGGPAAVVNVMGPVDLRSPERFLAYASECVLDLVGPEAPAGAFDAVSPICHVASGQPPVLTIHGRADSVVPVRQAQVLHRELARFGVPERLRIVEGAGHGFSPEQRDAATAELLDWFDLWLRGGGRSLRHAFDFTEGEEPCFEPVGDDPAAWQVSGAGVEHALCLVRRPAYTPSVRSPHAIALLRDVEVESFVLDVTMQSTTRAYGHRDLCLFFGWQDDRHFYYVHLAEQADDHAHSVFLVDGAPRISIARERNGGVAWERRHRVRLARDAERGTIDVYFDDFERPVISTVDRTFGKGRIGLGSFDDTGCFDTVRIYAW